MRLGWTTGRPLFRDDGGMAEKKCSRCAKVKPLAEFSRAAHGRDGRAAHCKDCHNALYRLPLDRVLTLTCLYCGKEFPNPARRGPTASSARHLARSGGGDNPDILIAAARYVMKGRRKKADTAFGPYDLIRESAAWP